MIMDEKCWSCDGPMEEWHPQSLKSEFYCVYRDDPKNICEECFYALFPDYKSRGDEELWEVETAPLFTGGRLVFPAVPSADGRRG